MMYFALIKTAIFLRGACWACVDTMWMMTAGNVQWMQYPMRCKWSAQKVTFVFMSVSKKQINTSKFRLILRGCEVEPQLAIELRKNSAAFDDAARDFENSPYIAEKLKLAANITVTLAHLIGGNGFKASFGPPGDWGYKNQIGIELRKVYDGEYTPGIITQEVHLAELINHVAILNLAISGQQSEFRLMANTSFANLPDELISQIEDTEKLMMERIKKALLECEDEV